MFFFEEQTITEDFFLKMTTRMLKRKVAEEIVSRDMETPLAENNSEENLIAVPSKSPRMQFENRHSEKMSCLTSPNFLLTIKRRC